MENYNSKRKRICVALLLGGKSVEHEVSLMSARNIYQALDKKKYQVQVIGITKNGRWLPMTEQLLLSNNKIVKEIGGQKKRASVFITPARPGFLFSGYFGKQMPFDVVFPVLHGSYGEDGSVQGLLKIIGIPFVGAGVLGSAVGMDKDVMKRILRDAGLPIGKFITINSQDKPPSLLRIKKEIGTPFFIKPANLGSSVGVSRVSSAIQYQPALAKAFKYDNKVIIEEYIEGREIECSVLGNEPPISSLPGEVLTDKSRHSFYSYEAKYIDEHATRLIIPAKLSSRQTSLVKKMAVQVFKALCCEGMGRVDFFLCNDGSILVNEINTIPGFTAISMYPKLWEASGISYSNLLDRLIALAFVRARREKLLKTGIIS